MRARKRYEEGGRVAHILLVADARTSAAERQAALCSRPAPEGGWAGGRASWETPKVQGMRVCLDCRRALMLLRRDFDRIEAGTWVG